MRRKLETNTTYFRKRISEIGFDVLKGEHPIIPVMVYDSLLAKRIASELLKLGIYVIAFNYPVVPVGKARIRIQISAAMERKHLDRALLCFKMVGEKFKLFKN